MRVAATIIGCYQVSPEDYSTSKETYIFDDTATIAEILARTGAKTISACNLSDVIDPPD
jgi:hypothetical protein